MNYGKEAVKRRQAAVDARSVKYLNKIGIMICQIILVAILIVGLAGIGAGVGVMKGIIDSAPDISQIDVIPTGYSTTVLADDGTQIATLVASSANRKYVTIDEIPLYLQHAFVAIEDSRFYEHNGIDLKGIIRALAINLQSGDLSQGASTITQQLIKNSVLEDTWAAESSKIESVQRKIQEQYLAMELEAQVDNKDWILENYMNTINLGSNTLGVQAASEHYFGKDVSELTLSECAVIAAITQNPSGYNPILHPEKNKERQLRVLEYMKDQKYISQEEYDEAVADNVYSRIAEHNSLEEDSASINSYFTDALIDDVFDDLINIKGYTETEAYKAIYQGGLTIYSTQNLDIQEICEEEARDPGNYATDTQYSFLLSFQVQEPDKTIKNYTHQTMLSYYKKTNKNSDYGINYSSEERARAAIQEYEDAMCKDGGKIVEGSESIYITLQPEVAMTIMDQETGEVKAIVGGREEKTSNRSWNRVTDTTRQPGSTFKIIGCFAAAIDSGGQTLASTQDDAPFTVGTKSYRNYDNSFRGLTNIRAAITDSINIVTLKTLQEIGIELGYQYAEQFGITTLCDTDKNLGLSLGGLTNGVTNLELTGAYATIANEGEYIAPTFYTKVLDHNGEILLDSSMKERHRVLKKTSAWLLTSAMEDVMTEGSGKAAYFGDTMAQAGKSGTTTSNRDSLFAGYTPYYTCVIWGGYDDNSKQTNTTYTKQIWHDVMERLHKDLEYKEFKEPAGIIEKKVCKRSGLLATGACPSYTEYFDEDQVPQETCTSHRYSSKPKKDNKDDDKKKTDGDEDNKKTDDSEDKKKTDGDEDNKKTDGGDEDKKKTDDNEADSPEKTQGGSIEEAGGEDPDAADQAGASDDAE